MDFRLPQFNILYLWYLGNPELPIYVGGLISLEDDDGASMQYSPSWIETGFALSKDVALVQFVLLPSDMLFTNIKRAAGAVDNARPDRCGEKVIRFVDQLECLSRAASPLPVLADAQHLSEVACIKTLTTWL